MKTQLTPSGHTPGPWAILSPLNSHMVCDDNQQVVAVATNGNEEANARLIAAAPELLAALRETQSYLDELANMQPSRDRGTEFSRIREVIQDSIAKATSQP